MEDKKRFNTYFKKKFPKSFKYLPMVKFVLFLLILLTLKMDYETYSVFSSTILEEESLILAPTEFYSPYLFCFYFIIIVYEYVLSIYVTLNANSPVQMSAFQIGMHTLRALGTTSALAVGYSHAPVEPNVVSNFVHTRTFFGRGYDYEIGSLSLKTKGDLVSGALGNKDMISAVQKHAPDSSIIDMNKLNNIINDPEFKSQIRAKTTLAEKALLGIPLIEISPNSSNVVGSDVSGSNSLEGFYETDDDDISTTPVIKESPIKRRHSEPLPRRSNRPAIQRRNIR